MANKTTAEVGGHHLQLAENRAEDPRIVRHEQNEFEVREVIKMVDYLSKWATRDNLIRNEVVRGALDMISGSLRMALGDY